MFLPLLIAKFLLGVVLLGQGADWLVRGATIVAERLRVPKSVAGLTLVAIGTSAPELVVNVLAALTGNTDFALPNISGSNLANLCIGFGLCGVLGGLAISKREFGVDAIFALVVVGLVWLLTWTTRLHALPLLAIVPLTMALLWYVRLLSRREGMGVDRITDLTEPFSTGLGLFVAGAVGLYVGGELVLRAGVTTAEAFHISRDVIGLTVIAIGTSVPDITATVVAALRGENSIAVGNILGSNISNVVLVLNATLLASQNGIETTPAVRFDYVIVALMTAVTCGLIFAANAFRERRVSPCWQCTSHTSGCE